MLSAYSVYNPDVGYCQGMNFVAALLLLTASEADVFWMLVTLVQDVLPARFYDRTMLGATVELDLLGAPPPLRPHHRLFSVLNAPAPGLLIERELPEAAAHLHGLGVMQHSFTAPWIICMYLNVLPVETTLRVWDALFCDGVVALHRVGLALLRMKQEELLQCKEFVAVMQFLSSFTLGAFNFDVIMREAYADTRISLAGDGAIKRLFRRFTKPFADVDQTRDKLFAAKAAVRAAAEPVMTLPVPIPPAIAAAAVSSSAAAVSSSAAAVSSSAAAVSSSAAAVSSSAAAVSSSAAAASSSAAAVSSSAAAAPPSSPAADAWVSGELFDFEGEGAAACAAVAAAAVSTPALPSWLAPNFGERYNRLSFLVRESSRM